MIDFENEGFNIVFEHQIRIVAESIFRTKVINSAAFNQVNTVRSVYVLLCVSVVI